MTKSFKEALKARRTFYQIENKSTLSDKEIRDLIRFAVEFVPSAFNSQTTRERVPAEVFGKTEEKIDGCFACGYGTILYFEDMAIVRSLQESFPTYKDNFPIWAEQTDAMHQLAVWTMLEDAGMGASLQHYNPLIDDEVRKAWNLPGDWKLVAQMPFGVPVAQPGSKEVMSLDERVFEFTD